MYEVYEPNCTCGAKMKFIGHVITDYTYHMDDDMEFSTDELFQCPSCKLIRIGAW